MARRDNINYTKLIQTVEKTVSNTNFYWESLALLFCLLFSYFCYLYLRTYRRDLIWKDYTSSKPPLLRKYLAHLLLPALFLISLVVGMLLYTLLYDDEIILFPAVIKLVTLLLFLGFVRVSGSNFTANLFGIFLVPVLILDITSTLDSSILFLDSYALKIGSVRFSLYIILKSLALLAFLFWLINLISRNAKSYINKNKDIKSSTKNIFGKLIDILAYSVIILSILKSVGVDLTAFAVIGGAIGVGIGFGLQKIASNFISGIILLFEKSVEIGDWVELEKDGISGTVKRFGGRYTLIECFDGKEVMIPNEDFIVGKVSNWTYSNSKGRIEIIFGVARDSDLTSVIAIAKSSAKSTSNCLAFPEPECYAVAIGEYDVKMSLRFWIADIKDKLSPARTDAIIALLKNLQEAKVNISLPRREITNI